MNEARYKTACTVFEGRVVVSGGYRNGASLNTVESYDHIADEWSYMPNMIEAGYGHNLVAVRNKLFVMGGLKRSVEVYDSTFKSFVIINPPIDRNFDYKPQAISVANKVVIFFTEYLCPSTKCLCYDLDKNEWTVETCGRTTNRGVNLYITVPKLNV